MPFCSKQSVLQLENKITNPHTASRKKTPQNPLSTHVNTSSTHKCG